MLDILAPRISIVYFFCGSAQLKGKDPYILVTFCCYLLKKRLPTGLIGTKTFQVVEQNGDDRGPQHGAS